MKVVIVLFCCLAYAFANGQTKSDNRIAGELIVWFNSMEASQQFLSPKKRSPFPIISSRRLSPKLNIHLLNYNPNQTNTDQLLTELQQAPNILFAQHNHKIDWRNLPNDPKFEPWRWSLDTIAAIQAWQTTTGGLTPNGDTIVVAIVDGGCDFEHEDLRDNMWYNWAEIPDNGQDDDNNGYIDDFKGWKIDTDTNVHEISTHGTSVASIIGAKGDNGLGMTGINWNVKLMMLSGDNGQIANEANMIEAYAYMLDMRRRYDQSAGQQGAYVVCTNASLGVNNADPANYPIWCAIYDSLGAAGILSVAATANSNTDVDVQGDMPTACTSDYLISVTRTTETDDLHSSAAYGQFSIDLGAPGAVYAARPNNSYNVFGGTSGAAPHVAGAVALLYSYPNNLFGQAMQTQPKETALLIKKLILNGVDKVASLEGKTTTGGRLDIGQSMGILKEYYSQPDSTNLLSVYPNPALDQLSAKCALGEAGEYQLRIFDSFGRKLSERTIIVDSASMRFEVFTVRDFQRGVHIVQLAKGRTCWTQKFIKY